MKSIVDDTVRAVIRRALQDIKAGDAFILGDLKESVYERIGEEEMLDKFFRYVSKSMAQSLSPKKMKKIVKQVSELLQSKRDMWKKEIRNIVQETSVDEAKSETREPTQLLDMEETTESTKKSKKRKSEDESSKKNPKQKMPRRDSSTKKNSPKRSSRSTAELEITRAVAKKEFEEEKARILAEVPEQHKSKWGQVGFARWGKEWLPCLIMGPYNVGPTSTMREQWMQMFENLRIQCPFSFIPCASLKTHDGLWFLFRRKTGEMQCHS
jgi:glucan-binding YG repeat protein